MKTTISVGDFFYDPIENVIREVLGMSQDHLGQPMVLFTPCKIKNKRLFHFGVTAWIVFKYFVKLE